jgi:hypothetical protein
MGSISVQAMRCELRKPWPFPTGAIELFFANATFKSLFPYGERFFFEIPRYMRAIVTESG